MTPAMMIDEAGKKINVKFSAGIRRASKASRLPLQKLEQTDACYASTAEGCRKHRYGHHR